MTTATPTAEERVGSPIGHALNVVFELFESRQIPYVVLHGFEDYPEGVKSDVDMLVPRERVQRQMPELVREIQGRTGMKVVQWIRDDHEYFVLSDEDARLLCLHLSYDYRCNGRRMYRTQEILRSRRKFRSFYVPSRPTEFCCTLARRIEKGNLRDEHVRRLTALYGTATNECRQHLRRFWNNRQITSIVSCAITGDWSLIAQQIGKFRTRGVVRRMDLGSRVRRWWRPPGLHVVFLGPDGVGKTTIIERVQQELEPAFFGMSYRTFAPMLLRKGPAAEKGPKPHSQRKRGLLASLVKAGWWSVYYTLGYFPTAYRDRARGKLVINHRYMVDALVDARRYRYSGPNWILRAIWKVSPKPELVIALDAPAEVIQARKSEVPPDETARQLERYRTVVGAMRIGRIINANQSVENVVLDVKLAILDALGERMEKRMGRKS